MLSIIIPAYQAETTIGRQLEAIEVQLSQLSPDGRSLVEVVVADNGSTDATAEAAWSFAGRLPVRVIDARERRGPSVARNRGAASAGGDVLVFTDADDVVLAGWLQAWLSWARDAGEMAVAAGQVYHDGAEPSGSGCRRPHHMGLPFASSNNMGISRALFDRLGGFDEERLTGEDADLSWRALDMGVELDCVRAGVRVSSGRRGWSTFRRYHQYGRGDVSLYRDHHRLGAGHEPVRQLIRVYLGLLVRLPATVRPRDRERWLRQAGRRSGRLVGSLRQRTWLP